MQTDDSKQAYELGYSDGEGSKTADFVLALDAVLPFDFDGPLDLASKLKRYLADRSAEGSIEIVAFAAIIIGHHEASKRVQCRAMLMPTDVGPKFFVGHDLHLQAEMSGIVTRVRFFSSPTGFNRWHDEMMPAGERISEGSTLTLSPRYKTQLEPA